MITAMLMAAAIQAAPAKPETKEEKTVVREIIVHDGKDGTKTRVSEVQPDILILRDDKDLPKSGERREIRIVRGGAPAPRIAMLADCAEGRKFETSAEGGDKDKRAKTKFLICAKGDKSDADMTQALERAAKRIAEDKEMPEDVRAKVLTQLNEEIARLKGGK